MTNIFQSIGELLEGIGTVLEIPELTDIGKNFKDIFNFDLINDYFIEPFVTSVINFSRNTIKYLYDGFKDILEMSFNAADMFTKLFDGDFSGAGEHGIEIMNILGDFILKSSDYLIKATWNVLYGILGSAFNGIFGVDEMKDFDDFVNNYKWKDAKSDIYNYLSTLFDDLGDYFTNNKFIRGIFAPITNNISSIIDGLGLFGEAISEAIFDYVSIGDVNWKKLTKDIGKSFLQVNKGVIGALSEWGVKLFTEIGSWIVKQLGFDELADSIDSMGREFNFNKWFDDAINEVSNALTKISEIWDSILNFDITSVNWGDIGSSIASGTKSLILDVVGLFGEEARQSVIEGFDKLGQWWNSLTDYFTTFISDIVNSTKKLAYQIDRMVSSNFTANWDDLGKEFDALIQNRKDAVTNTSKLKDSYNAPAEKEKREQLNYNAMTATNIIDYKNSKEELYKLAKSYFDELLSTKEIKKYIELKTEYEQNKLNAGSDIDKLNEALLNYQNRLIEENLKDFHDIYQSRNANLNKTINDLKNADIDFANHLKLLSKPMDKLDIQSIQMYSGHAFIRELSEQIKQIQLNFAKNDTDYKNNKNYLVQINEYLNQLSKVSPGHYEWMKNDQSTLDTIKKISGIDITNKSYSDFMNEIKSNIITTKANLLQSVKEISPSGAIDFKKTSGNLQTLLNQDTNTKQQAQDQYIKELGNNVLKMFTPSTPSNVVTDTLVNENTLYQRLFSNKNDTNKTVIRDMMNMATNGKLSSINPIVIQQQSTDAPVITNNSNTLVTGTSIDNGDSFLNLLNAMTTLKQYA